MKAVQFIQERQAHGEKVYVHCKAAHGRVASIALCWMLKQHPGKTSKVCNTKLFFSRIHLQSASDGASDTTQYPNLKAACISN